MATGEPTISFIGFGEAGVAIASGLREAGIEQIAAWDILFPAPDGEKAQRRCSDRRALRHLGGRCGVRRGRDHFGGDGRIGALPEGRAAILNAISAAARDRN